MTPSVNDLARELADRMSGRRDKAFIEAAMAVCALVATADKRISYSERLRVHRLLEGVGALGTFPRARAIGLFDAYADDLAAEEPGARERILSRVRAVAGDPGIADTLIRVSVLICTADDEVHEAEVAEITEICGALGIDPATAGF